VTRPLSVGIIGTGIHGSRYARHILADLPELQLAAISRRSEVGVAQSREWNCRLHPDWRDLVEDSGVEAVIAVLTPDLHPAIAAACARAGKPLLIEKPLAIRPEAGEFMLEAMAVAGQPLTVAQTLRYNPVIRGLRANLRQAGRLHAFTANQRLEPSTHPWLEIPALAGGGVILHTAVHLFDALRFITGRELISVRALSRRRYNPELEDLFLATLEFEGDLIGNIDAGKVSPAREGRYSFLGEAGQLQGDQIHGELSFQHGLERKSLPLEPDRPTLLPLMEEWLAHLRGRGPNPIPGEEGLAALRICEACRLSAAAKREVTL
jgi:predicted dehydrogenase